MNNKFGINQNQINRVPSISEEKLANRNNFQSSTVDATHNVNFNPFNTTQFNVPNQLNYNPQPQMQQVPIQQFQPQHVVVPQQYQQTQQVPVQQYTQQIPVQQQPQMVQNQTPFVTKTVQVSTQQLQPQQPQQLQFVPLQQNLISQYPQEINNKFLPQQQMLYSEVEQDFFDDKTETAKIEIKLKKLEKLFKLRYITAEEYLRKKREIIKKTIEEIA
ncbi:MAG: hypothetical protein ACRDBR_02345 [Metamycoplasmataceae bacterium]